jgi:hypothetical protein
MDFSGIIERLDAEWDTDGFFDRVRNGGYDAIQAQDILEMLRTINIEEDQLLPKRLVTLLWYLPSFLGWQVERVAEKGGDSVAYRRFITEVHNTLEEVLGTP